MSFVCHLWEYPAPRDSAEVEPILRALRAGGAPSGSPLFIEFFDRILERYPCITTLSDDEVDEVGVWTDGPLGGIGAGPVYNLGILSQHIEHVFPFVCEVANDVGLNVHETVAGTTHRADGAKLQWEDVLDRRMSSSGLDLTRLSGLFADQFDAQAAKHGFRKIGYHRVRGFDGGWQAFVATVGESKGRIVADIAVQTFRYDVMRKALQLDPKAQAGDPAGVTFALSVYEFHKSHLFAREPDELLAAARDMRPVVESRLLPAADECTTLAGLDAVMNTGRTAFRHFPLNHLLVSHFSGHKDLDPLYATLREQGHIGDAMALRMSEIRDYLQHGYPESRDEEWWTPGHDVPKGYYKRGSDSSKE